MPKYFHSTFEDGGVAIWHITETVDALYALLNTQRYDSVLATIRHETRRAEWLAVRVLLAEVLGDDKEIAYHASGRPYLVDDSWQISISHTKGYAAIAYHRQHGVGIDIERLSSRVERIADRFTSSEEALYIGECNKHQRMMLYLINWSAKETLYKLFDSPSMAEFKEVFHVAPYALAECGTMNATVCNAEKTLLAVSYRTFPEFVCTWAVSREL
jgi:phosphopantetheinyl transferase